MTYLYPEHALSLRVIAHLSWMPSSTPREGYHQSMTSLYKMQEPLSGSALDLMEGKIAADTGHTGPRDSYTPRSTPPSLLA